MLHQDLIEQFESTVVPVLQSELTYTDPKTASLDEKFMQVSLPLNNPEVVFTSGGKVVERYDELQELTLTNDDKKLVDIKREELSKKPNFYDGDQMLVTGVKQKEGRLELEVVRTKYSVLASLANKVFPENSKLYTTALYKCGVMAPFITTDGHTVFAERTADKLYSVAAGFLEPIGAEKSLKDLVRSTAFSESIDEFLGDKEGDIRVGIKKEVKIAQVSFRKMKNGMGTVEFVAPFQLNCNKSQLEQVISTNAAKDAKDHTSNRFWVNFNGSADEAKSALSGKAGKFLYNPILLGATAVSITDEAKRASFVNDVLKPREIGGFIAHSK